MTDAFDSALSCYSDHIAENHLNVLENTQSLDEKHIVSSGDYSPKTAKILGGDIVALDSTSTCSIALPKITLVCQKIVKIWKTTSFLQERRGTIG